MVTNCEIKKYNDVIVNQLQDYILDEKNMEKALEMKIVSLHLNKEKKPTTYVRPYKQMFIPREKETLFWCFYIIKNGDIKYETTQNKNELMARQIKITYVEKIRKEKKTVKIYKFDTISNIESNLVNDNFINPKTFLTLCAIENINVIYITKKTYFELLMNDTDEVFVVYEINNGGNGKYNIKYGFELGNTESINNIKKTLYRVDNIDKPIKAISSYKTQELVEICNKLAIEIVNKDTNKTKPKKDLYEGIIHYLQI
jgi:hypothetical protein